MWIHPNENSMARKKGTSKTCTKFYGRQGFFVDHDDRPASAKVHKHKRTPADTRLCEKTSGLEWQDGGEAVWQLHLGNSCRIRFDLNVFRTTYFCPLGHSLRHSLPRSLALGTLPPDQWGADHWIHQQHATRVNSTFGIANESCTATAFNSTSDFNKWVAVLVLRT